MESDGIIPRNVIFDGILGYTDRYVLGTHNELYLLSIYGSTQSVNAILGAAAQHRPLRIQLAGEPLARLNPEILQDSQFRANSQYVIAQREQDYSNRRTCQFQSKRLSYGRAHGIWYDLLVDVNAAASDFIVVGRTRQEAQTRLYQSIDSRPIPLLPQWNMTLVEMLEGEGFAVELLCHGCFAYLIRYDEPGILDLIGKGIAHGQLPLA